MSTVAALGTSNGGYPIPGQKSGGSRTSLDGEIAQCQRQLADLVTCPSSKTPEGKAAMQAISDKMSAARAAINNASATAAPPVVAQPSPDGRLVDAWA